MAEGDAAVKTDAPGAAQEDKEVKKGDSAASAEDKVDYKAELEKERAARQKAESERETYKAAMYQKKEFVRDRKESEDDDQGEDASDRIAEKVLEKIAPVFTRNVLEDVVGKMTTNPDKQELIKWHYEHSIQKSGLDPTSVRKDLLNALAIADSARLKSERDEAARAAATSKNNTSFAGSNTGADRDDKARTHGWTSDQILSMRKTFKEATGKEMSDKAIDQAWVNFQKRKAAAA